MARNGSSTKRQQEALALELARVHKRMERLLTAYQEDLLSLDELRSRLPEQRQREQVLKSELQSINSQMADREEYLKLAETLSSFLERLRVNAETLNVLERQKIVRLLVREVLVDDNSVTIRHSIPLHRSLMGNPTNISVTPHDGGHTHSNNFLYSGRHVRKWASWLKYGLTTMKEFERNVQTLLPSLYSCWMPGAVVLPSGYCL